MLDENNIYEDSPYYDLTLLAAECTAKRMTPDFISAKIMRERKGDVYPSMGCRSFLTPDRFTDNGIGNIAKAKNYVPGKHKYWGRMNQGVCTLNLPYIALLADKDETKFWELLDKYIELAHQVLRVKHERLLGTKSDVAPLIWQHGVIARLDKGEVIDPLLYNGYSTISLGYAGICEMTYAMKGVPQTEPEGKEFALKVMQRLNDKCAEFKEQENIDYSVYGTPIENTTEKFARALQRRFGKIPHISDKNYVTNSFHVHVTQPISPFEKLGIESEFEALSPGGVVEYIEAGGKLSDNLDAVLAVMRFIYDHNQYAEINTKSDYCHCGYDGEIEIKTDEHGKHYWQCPACGNTDKTKMHITRRSCGFIGTNYWGQGRSEEIKERYEHL